VALAGVLVHGFVPPAALGGDGRRDGRVREPRAG
jgi:hypothetical protein